MKALALSLFLFFSLNSFCQSQNIQLPKPDTTGGKPLMECLKNRQSGRSYVDKTIELQHLSNLLWAAYGINRYSPHKRTAPSTLNVQEFVLYVFLADAVYTYNAINHELIFVMKGDFRHKTGTQDYVKNASANIVFVADYSKMTKISKAEDKDFYAAVDCGFISQNIYLYCSSAGLTSVVRASINKEELSNLLKLSENMKIILAQSVGYSKTD